MNGESDAMPPYSYVPGGPWPHPVSSPLGHMADRAHARSRPIEGDDWASSAEYLRGIALFNAGYYWESHEVWEGLWHAHGRKGPIADLLKALIKLGAAGVKVREGQPGGVATHARRAADLFDKVRAECGDRRLGLDLRAWAEYARRIADDPPRDHEPFGSPVSRVLPFRIEPA